MTKESEPGVAKDADRIRQYVLEHYIEPAREEGREQTKVLVSDVNRELQLNNAWPNICQALAGDKFQKLAQVPPPERIGANQSSATVFQFDLRDHRVDRSALYQLRKRFLAVCPDFKSFVNPGTGWAKEEKAYKVAASERVRVVVEEGGTDEILGKAVFEILKTAAKDGPFVRWQTEDSIAKHQPEMLGEFHAVIGRLIRSVQPPEEVLSEAFDALTQLKERGAASLTYGERLNILFSALSMVRPGEAAPLKITRINDAWDKLTGEKLFVQATADMARDYRRFAGVFSEIFVVMRDDWQWQPQDWLDLQGFLWIACSENGVIPMPNPPTNLILYGPPGTGKTFSTASEAVSLCGEPVPKDREALMETYQRLLAAGRIEFITFHQSMSYEDFVEGRQPMTASDEDGDNSSAGFRLETVPGIFRRIAKRAETSRGRSPDGAAITPAEPEHFVLIIDEINRANISKVFGELITLLEPDKRLGQPNALRVRLPYSGDDFGVPSNLHILATMNTADRSIALLDTALRRRFTFREMMPNPSVLAEAAEKCGLDLPRILESLNERIEYLYDREHQIGHAYFIGCALREDVDAVMRDKVIPLLAEYFFEDWGKIAAVLGDARSHDGRIEGGFLKRSVIKAPPGLEDGPDLVRFHWEVRSEDEGFDYTRLEE